LVFGSVTFSIPFLSGIGVGLLAGYFWLTAVRIGPLIVSHSMFGFPIVQHMKLVTAEVVVTIGGIARFFRLEARTVHIAASRARAATAAGLEITQRF
jgi:hypothetical protein